MALYLASKGYDPADLVRRDQYDHWRQWPISERDWWRAYREAIRQGFVFNQFEPAAGAACVISDLRAAGHQVWLVTARNVPGVQKLCRAQTRAYCAAHNLVPDRIVFTTNKAVPGIDWLVDDQVSHLLAAQSAGARTVLWRCAHNQQDRWPLEADSWPAVRSILEDAGVLQASTQPDKL
jgi:5'(3')-deoxyribonucleotidase